MTRDMTKLRVDRVFYSPWCDEEGKVLDDGTIARLDDTTYRVTAADPSYRWFTMNATGLDVEVDDISDRTAALALQGRLSREVLQDATGARTGPICKYFGRRPTEIAGVAVDVTRTGYTGDRGLRALDARRRGPARSGTGSSTSARATASTPSASTRWTSPAWKPA